MAIHRLVFKQQIPAPIEEVWAFFSNPHNLATITPESMRFRVLNESPLPEIYPGLIITYKVSPLLGIPLFWMTEITSVQRLKLFVDEQRRGPYKLWHHQHLFEENKNGVLMTDMVHYELPLGPLGGIARRLFVGRQLAHIFQFRKEKVESIFGLPGQS